MLFELAELLADNVVVDELAIKETAQALCDLQKATKTKKKISSSFGAVQSPQPQQQKTSGSKYPSKFDRMLALAEKKRANAQPNTTAITNTPPSHIDSSDTSGPDIISVCDFVDLT